MKEYYRVVVGDIRRGEIGLFVRLDWPKPVLRFEDGVEIAYFWRDIERVSEP